ncbi:MAG: pyridoxal-phosphate dependent enzyme [Planctomycetota bacterium]|nr:pyridoxal-phosphate dependent enzyme [Planctomycetota bacterium]
MSIWRWENRFATRALEPRHRISLGEGDTPLVRSTRIGPSAGLHDLWFKLEGCNPTGSYKDRFAVAAIADMLATGKDRCLATSSGNTGAALAACCAVAGIACQILIVQTAPPEKLKQMMVYGADITMIKGFGLDAETTHRVLHWLKEKSADPKGKAMVQISGYAFSPAGMAGVQTISYELAEQAAQSPVSGGGAIGGAPRAIDHVFSPAGGGGLTLAVARGFANAPDGARSPRIECVQPRGNDTIAGALRAGEHKARSVACTSKISGLQVPTVIDGDEVIAACRASGGTGHTVEDADVWAAQARLAREEGIFSEPAGATALAGALQAAARGEIRRDARIVCLVTGTGFKDAPSVDRMLEGKTCPTMEMGEFEKR